MTMDLRPGQTPLVPPPPPSWGELAPDGRTAHVLRLALGDRTVTFPYSEFKRWEHLPGERDVLTLVTAGEQIVIEGRDLTAVRAALDLGRLAELHLTLTKFDARPGPRIERITIEPA